QVRSLPGPPTGLPSPSPEVGGSPTRSRHCESQTRYPGNGTRDPRGVADMNAVAVVPAAQPIAIPVRQWGPYLIFAGVLMLFLAAGVGVEQGAARVRGGHLPAECVHAARHLLGFPCH